MDEKLDPMSSLRQFSLSSSPNEEDLTITTTIKGRNSRFKENMDAPADGQEFWIFGPNGSFFLKEKKIVFFWLGIWESPPSEVYF
ncbi:hypothetical protein OXIME_001180 [Oxyplasma meridianum]|uniref:Uncharacterized protein n=1 Tax=Oxyplasma meridianum TaxID=3073602 RepID=A0AAX4NGI6_9ARCH